MICAPCTLQQELNKMRSTLINNGYTVNIINRKMESKIEYVSISPKFGPSLCPIYLKLPSLGRKCKILIDEVSKSVSSTIFSAKLRVDLDTCPVFVSFTKDLSKSFAYLEVQCETEKEAMVTRLKITFHRDK